MYYKTFATRAAEWLTDLPAPPEQPVTDIKLI